MSRIRNLIILVISVFFLWLTCGLNFTYAKSGVGIEQFVGYYLCETETVGEYENPEVLSLSFNGEGQLQRYSGMYYGTTGTSIYYDYTSVSIKGNTLTCKYDGAYGYYGEIAEIEPDSHQYILNEDGSIIAEGKTWYRYERGNAQKDIKTRTLLAVRDIDFAYGKYTPDATFLGIQELSRREIKSITFLDTMEDAPEQTWDVSEAQDGSVKLWLNEENGDCHVCIAADGGVIANYCSNDLFRLCTNLTEIDFNSAFDTNGTTDFSHMFRDCKKLSAIWGLDSLDTHIACDMNSMFRGCSAMEKLDLRSFVFGSDCSTSDMFSGTKWEGSSPLLDYGDTGVGTACILDTSVLKDSLRLRARVINGYDDILCELIEGKTNIWGEWKDANCYVFYDMKDITGDNIPELIVRTDRGSEHDFEIYYFEIASCTIRKIGGAIQSNGSELYWYPQENILSYSTGSGYQNVRIEDFVLREIYDCDVKDLRSEQFEYTLAASKEIEYYKCDLSGDGSANTIKIKATVNETGNYNYLAIYVDGIKAFEKELSGTHSDIVRDLFQTGDLLYFLYLRVGSEYSNDYTALLKYNDGSFAENMVMSDLIEEEQLRTDYENYNNNCFSINVGDRDELKMTFYLNTYGLGDKLEFSVGYEPYLFSEFRQTTFVADIDNTWSQSRNATAVKKFSVYKNVRGKDTVYTVNPGDHVYYDKIWFSNGLIWVRLENEAGEKGWIPAGNDVLFKEVREKAEDMSLWERVVNLVSDEKDFDLDIPEPDVLYQLGKEYFDEGDFDTAEIYFDLINEDSLYYEDMREMLDTIHSGSSGIPSEEQVNSSGFDERIIYADYINENVEDNGGYAVLDINGDGRKELLIYYELSNYNGSCEVYTFDEQNDRVQYAGIVGNVTYGVCYSQQYQSLVNYFSTPSSQSYRFYCFDGKNLNESFNVGWHDEKGETYTRYFSYSDQNGNQDLGHYVYHGENENVGKAEAEENFHKYLQYMIEIEFTPINEFLYDENGQAYAYEFSTDNILMDELDCMLPVIHTYLSSGRGYDTGSPGRTAFDTSYRKEDIWNFLWLYSIYMYEHDNGSYTMDEIQRLVYSLFPDYDGILPEIPENSGIQREGDTVTFMPATPEEKTVSLLEYKVLADGSVDALYELTQYPEDLPEKVFVHLVKNEKADYSSYIPLYYRITYLERRSEETKTNTGNMSEPEAAEDNQSENDFVIADSDSRYLTVEDLAGMDADTLRYARNEIYARRGRRFKDQELQSYFDSKAWYQGVIEPEDFQENMLSDVERKNAELILNYEKGE